MQQLMDSLSDVYPHDGLGPGVWDMRELRLGWPLRCAVGRRLVHLKWQSRYEEIASYESNWITLSPIDVQGPNYQLAIPPVLTTGIVPSATLINAALFTSLAFLLLSLPLWTWRLVARVVRRHFGHCPRCSYDLHHNLTTGCPECGWKRKAKPNSGTIPTG